MKPIRFTCTDTMGLLPADIAGRILDLANWSEFKGYVVLPGIRAAESEVRTPGVVGSRIRVSNTDGSSHVETAGKPSSRRNNRIVRRQSFLALCNVHLIGHL